MKHSNIKLNIHILIVNLNVNVSENDDKMNRFGNLETGLPVQTFLDI